MRPGASVAENATAIGHRCTVCSIRLRRVRSWLKRERTGDSPEKLAQRHTPPGDSVDLMLELGGVERESAFKPDKK